MNKRMLATVLVFLMVFSTMSVYAAPSDTSLQQMKVNGISVNVVTINLNSPDIEVGVSTGLDRMYYSEPFMDQIKRNGADIACNGNFFQSYSEQGSRNFWGGIVKNGEFISGGGKGTFLFAKGEPAIYLTPENRGDEFFSEYQNRNIIAGVSGDPSIVENGVVVAGQKATTRRDIYDKASRTGMGITADNQLKIVTGGRVSILELGEIMRSLGCMSAVNLDGGASSALYYRGKMVTKPGRDLNVVFYVRDLGKNKPKESKKTVPANSATTTVRLNHGEVTEMESYNIDGRVVIKLRDFTALISGTEKRVQVSWDGAKNMITLTSGAEYTKNGSELSAYEKKNKQATVSDAKILKDGTPVPLKAFNIAGNNFFSLRELCRLFDINIVYDEATKEIHVLTSESYSE